MNFWVIDDDSIYQMLIKRMVAKSHPHISVSTHLNGKVALDAIENLVESSYDAEYPDVIFLDINMPVMNGWEFLDNLIDKGLPEVINSKIYIVSSSIDKSDFEKARQYELVSEYLVKPLSRSDFDKYLPAAP